MSAAIHKMHLEIVSGRTLYAECQHQRELFRKSVFSEVPQVNVYLHCNYCSGIW